jgi:copper(I)-binding protein
MSIKLSAVALGITLAFGATAAMSVNNAAITQNGNWNDSTIQQVGNTDAYASITSRGDGNDNVVVQQNTTATRAVIETNWGNSNDNTVLQNNVVNSTASVYQVADSSTTVINQGGTSVTTPGHWVYKGRDKTYVPGTTTVTDGRDQHAHIAQNSGSNHDAYIGQTGTYVRATVYQSGYGNDAVITQAGSGSVWSDAVITQSGYGNDATINQAGGGLNANIYQAGYRNSAVVTQAGMYQTASVSQTGSHNNANISQR